MRPIAFEREESAEKKGKFGAKNTAPDHKQFITINVMISILGTILTSFGLYPTQLQTLLPSRSVTRENEMWEGREMQNGCKNDLWRGKA